jgi:hypothetical protein
MRRLTGLRLIRATALSLALAAPASAQFVVTKNQGSANVKTIYGPGGSPPPYDITNSFGPFGGAAVADVDMFSLGRLRAVQTGYGLNAVFVSATLADLSFFDWSARTDYDVEVTEVGQSRSSLDFQYHLNGGRLALYDPSGNFDGKVARVGVSIFAISPGFSGFLWSWSLSLRGSQGSVTPSVDFFIDPLGFGQPALSPITFQNGYATLDIANFTANANLGILSGNATAFVTYDMDAAVAGGAYNGGGGIAALGDPFNTSGDYGAGITLTGSPAAVVPEPAAFVLLGTGLLAVGGLGWSRRRRAVPA